MARPDKWARYPIGNEAFTGEFPAEPALETRSVEGMPGKIYICTCHDEAMNTYAALLLDDLGLNAEKLAPAQLDDFYKGMAVGLKRGILSSLSKIESSFEIKEAGEKDAIFAGFAGKERRYTIGPSRAIIRMTVSGRRMLAGFTVVSLDATDESVERFFASFHFSKVPAK
jgi:hypothetical protein